jgi:hypothetical protein
MFTGRDPYPAIRRRQKATWVMIVPYIAGVAGITLAAVTMAMFLLFRSATTAQITELRQEVATAQQAQADTAGAVTGLSNRVKGLTGDLNAVGDLVTPFTTICSTDLTGPGGPAQYDFLCRLH